MKIKQSILALVITAIAVSCDDGRIYDSSAITATTGRTLHLTATIKGAGNWPDGYRLVTAGFNPTSNYALIAKDVMPAADGTVEHTMTQIDEEATTVELCIIDRLRKRIVTYESLDCTGAATNIEMNLGELDVSMYPTIQNKIFNTYCIQCHGGSTYAGAGLYLTTGKSYDALVNVQSIKSPAGALLVTPGNAEASFLHTALNTDISSSWRIDHIDIIQFPALLTIIDEWINAGAKK